MRIVLDENLPRPPARAFPGHQVATVQGLGLAGTANGVLFRVSNPGMSEFRRSARTKRSS